MWTRVVRVVFCIRLVIEKWLELSAVRDIGWHPNGENSMNKGWSSRPTSSYTNNMGYPGVPYGGRN